MDRIRRTTAFLERITKKYYESVDVSLPQDFALREFAAQKWGSTGYIRHMSFTSKQAVKDFLVKTGPRHFYYSSARYDNPSAEDMDSKGWRSSDIIFDIDADHLGECREKVVEINDPETGVKTSFIDETCIRVAAFHTCILLETLEKELGFHKTSISAEFSGNRGFHVVVYLKDSDEWARVGQDVRRELVNYLNAKGLVEDTVWPKTPIEPRGRRRTRRILPVPPLSTMPGVRGRIARIAAFIAEREGATGIARIFVMEPLEAAYTYSRLGEKAKTVIERAIAVADIGVDEQVTLDLKRLIRVPYSLHGKTLLPVLPLEHSRICEFRLSREISPFNNMDMIRIQALVDTPQIGVLGTRLKLRKGHHYKLPAPVALFLMAKEVAVLSHDRDRGRGHWASQAGSMTP